MIFYDKDFQFIILERLKYHKAIEEKRVILSLSSYIMLFKFMGFIFISQPHKINRIFYIQFFINPCLVGTHS